jgi:CheY-like chemotaxis protein
MTYPTAEEMMDTKMRPQDVNVLVVDDEVDIAIYLASVLEDAGMNVVVAHDGVQALDLIQSQPFLRKDRELSRIPVVIVTAHARDAGVRKDLDEVLAERTMAGPSMYLEKPVTPHRYLLGICEILGVEPAGDISKHGDSHVALRDEARDLIENLDAATLEALVGQLRQDHS